MLASMCQLQALDQFFPQRNVSTQTLMGATSGGILGGVLRATAGGRLGPSWQPRDYGSGTAHKELTKHYKIDVKDSAWFGAITDVLAPLIAQTHEQGGEWWLDVLGVASRLYNIDGAALQHPSNLITTVTMLRASTAPLDRTPEGVLRNATNNLFPGEITMGHGGGGGTMRAVGATAHTGPPPLALPDVLTAASYSTSFWAAPILESPWLYALAGQLLPRYPPPNEQFLLLDGGTVDSTGLATLVRRNVSSIVAFYNDAVDLNAYSAQLSFLFGVDNRTTGLAMWEGARLGQIFPSRYWPAVLANLSSPEIGVAELRDLPVLPNDYLGVAGNYKLRSLLLLATQPSEPFLREFDAVDTQVRKSLRKGWPEAIDLLGMSALETNTLCMLSGWRIENAKERIQEVMGW